MPIKEISDRRRPPRGGKIRIGEKIQGTRQDGSTYERPEKLDHFKFDPEDIALLPVFEQKYGQEPKSIPVMFYSDDREEVFPHYLKTWRSGKLFCWGDGNIAHRADFEKGTTTDIPCLPDCPFRILPREDQAQLSPQEKKVRTCGPEGMLRFILYEMPTLGVFEIRAATTSIVRINTCLDMIQGVAGRLMHIPLVLSVVPVHQTVGNKAQTNYCLQIDIRRSLLELMETRDRKPAGLIAAPADPAPEEEKEPGGDDGEDDVPETQKEALGELRGAFSDLMDRAYRAELVTMEIRNSAVAWAGTAPSEALQKKITRWKADVEAEKARREPREDQPPPMAGTAHHDDEEDEALEAAFVAEHVARNLEKDILACRSLDDLAGAMLAHPGLNGARTRLQQAWDSAESDEVKKAVLFQARTEILALK